MILIKPSTMNTSFRSLGYLDIHVDDLCYSVVAGYVWTLVFSTSQHGFSLNSLYRKMNRLESPILMVIEDTEHNVSAA